MYVIESAMNLRFKYGFVKIDIFSTFNFPTNVNDLFVCVLYRNFLQLFWVWIMYKFRQMQ